MSDLEFLLKAMQQIDAYCYILGDGTHRGYFERLSDEFSVGDKTIFLGWVNPREIPSYLISADVICFPMQDNEFNKYRFPTKLCEYLASGVPLVVSNVGEVRYILNDDCAFLVEDLVDLSRIINQVLSNPELAKIKSNNARKLALEKFDKQKQIDSLLDIYEQL